MRGIGYLIVEIVLLLIASAAIGYLIGRVLHKGGRTAGRSSALRSGAAPDSAALQTKSLVLEGRLTETQQEIEELKRQLTLERLRSQGDAGAG